MLSTAASSTPRGTATSTAQASPITALVVKFQCLFTHDLRRKSKRWHDGYLRYHTFNKRIMVYDDQGNFVGDHHWRSTEEVGDGDEFELDKGVLIQVGERISTTQTDISNLFEKRKSSQTSPQSKELGHQPLRSVTAIRSSGSSQPFRSLNDLLGIKRTPIGPSMSPYEARHRVPPSSHNVQSLEAERAPKRQKVAASELALTSHHQVRDEVVDLTADEPNLVIFQDTTSVQEVELSNTTGATRWNARPPSNEEPRAAITAKSVRPDSGTSAQPSNPASSKSSNKGSINSKNSAVDRAPHFEIPELSSPPSSYLAPPSSSQKSSRTISDASVMPWRMPIKKPRPKLMYTALLPRGGQQKLSAPSTNSTEKQSHQPISESRVSRVTNGTAQEMTSTNAEFLPSDSTQFILEEMVDAPDSRKAPERRSKTDSRQTDSSLSQHLPAKRSLDMPLRKSLSDPTALTSRPGLPARPTLIRDASSAVPEQITEFEEGPWTVEALDLFDFWPPGRPKPYWAGS